MPKKPRVAMPAVVEKIVKPQGEPEKAQIAVEGADHLYREIRIQNKLNDENGRPVAMKPGEEIEVTIEAEPDATSVKE